VYGAQTLNNNNERRGREHNNNNNNNNVRRDGSEWTDNGGNARDGACTSLNSTKRNSITQRLIALRKPEEG